MTTETATLAGGCFWCIEAVFKEVDGVETVTSGYAGGRVEQPTYEEVCTGETGHAEAVKVVYDPDTIAYEDLLHIFFRVHDPTTEDRQGPDVGSQYRSAIFYHDEAQREVAERVIDEIQDGYEDEIVTEVEPLDTFYEAEDHHQNYFEKHPDQAYCRVHIPPKLEKLQDGFPEHARERSGEE